MTFIFSAASNVLFKNSVVYEHGSFQINYLQDFPSHFFNRCRLTFLNNSFSFEFLNFVIILISNSLIELTRFEFSFQIF